MAKCTRCRQEKETTEFFKDSRRPCGHAIWCKACENQYFREHSLQVYWKFKEDNPCTDCGGFFPHYVMEFDHMMGDERPRSKRGFADRVRTVEAILRKMERDRVELVCANCHKARTWVRGQQRKMATV